MLRDSPRIGQQSAACTGVQPESRHSPKTRSNLDGSQPGEPFPAVTLAAKSARTCTHSSVRGCAKLKVIKLQARARVSFVSACSDVHCIVSAFSDVRCIASAFSDVRCIVSAFSDVRCIVSTFSDVRCIVSAFSDVHYIVSAFSGAYYNQTVPC